MSIAYDLPLLGHTTCLKYKNYKATKEVANTEEGSGIWDKENGE